MCVWFFAARLHVTGFLAIIVKFRGFGDLVCWGAGCRFLMYWVYFIVPHCYKIIIVNFQIQIQIHNIQHLPKSFPQIAKKSRTGQDTLI